jgi:hypothetical protein
VLDGEVDGACMCIPIVGHGNGCDKADKVSYKGDGSLGGRGDFYFKDGVFTFSQAMYEHACAMVTSFISIKSSG